MEEKIHKFAQMINECNHIVFFGGGDVSTESGVNFEEMRAIIRAEYEKYPYITILDGMKLVPPNTCFYGDAGELKAHPNAEGFWHYARNLEKAIRK